MDNIEEGFFDDINDLLNSLEECFLKLETDADNQELLEQAFRDLHTIKGAAYMFDMRSLGDFIHQLENVYDHIRNGKYSINKEIIICSLNSIDFGKQALQDPVFTKATTRKRAREIINDIEAIIENSALSNSLSEDKSLRLFLIEIDPKVELAKNDGHPLHFLIDDLKENPHLEFLIFKKQPGEAIKKWKLLVETTQKLEEIESLFIFIEDDLTLFIEEFILEPGRVKFQINQLKGSLESKSGIELVEDIRLAIIKSAEVQENSEVNNASTGKKKLKDKIQESSYIKVSRKKIDDLMSWVSELITMQATLKAEADRFQSQTLYRVSENMEFITENLRQTIFSVSLMPISRLETRFNRLIHDLSNSLGKEVNFSSEGRETELDKKIIDTLMDPLLHVIRNCMDHGIETPEIRMSKGKAKAGNIHLNAYYNGNHVIIEISDDGKGIDPEIIKKKAIERGIIGSEDNLKKEDLLNMIFHPGFSTAEKVSDVSGRGVGMDVVRKKIQEIRGEVLVTSEVDQGTSLTIKIPLSLSIIDGLLTKVGNLHFVLPLNTVREIHRVEKKVFSEMPPGSHILDIEGHQMSVISLEHAFDIADIGNSTSDIVTVDVGLSKKGIAVDQIKGQIKAVLKPLSEYYEAQEFISGGTILGDGSLALILDINQLITKN
ncbi:chemotaxis protein CheA [Marivirga sp. S37H4]|uniref:Chemotaxis protein CheA n=1 Tax=Marivirga aurantiaca TaxID=2802615 RepID=A0A935C7T5_9BACT|nr:chemotaxis protein CheA [Marivirga aurantiaca]MBK6264552.1 chemotaxis protein CheA [Marivirga aurantiaca]